MCIKHKKTIFRLLNSTWMECSRIHCSETKNEKEIGGRKSFAYHWAIGEKTHAKAKQAKMKCFSLFFLVRSLECIEIQRCEHTKIIIIDACICVYKYRCIQFKVCHHYFYLSIILFIFSIRHSFLSMTTFASLLRAHCRLGF